MSPPKLIERFLDREETALPDIYLPLADGALLAGDDLPGADSHTLAPDDKYTWVSTLDGKAFQRWTEKGEQIDVVKFGDYWFINLSDGPFPEEKFQALVFAFDRLPICTRSAAQAMQLAEHCYPDPRPADGRLLGRHNGGPAIRQSDEVSQGARVASRVRWPGTCEQPDAHGRARGCLSARAQRGRIGVRRSSWQSWAGRQCGYGTSRGRLQGTSSRLSTLCEKDVNDALDALTLATQS